MHRLTLAFALLGILLLAAPAIGDDRPVLLFSGYGNWAPYLTVDSKSGKATGALHDVLLEACAAAEVDCRYEQYPWKRVLDYLDFGDIDIVCGIYSTVGRRGQFIFSSPIYREEVCIFTAKPLKVDDIADLKGLRGDALLGARYGDYVDAYISLYLDVVRWTDLRLSFDRLVKGNTDYTIAPRGNGRSLVRSMNLQDRIKPLPYVLGEQDVFIAYSRHSKHKEHIPAINRELDRLVQSGRAAELLQPYLIP